MNWSRRQTLDGELMEVRELIGEWKEDFGADFQAHYEQVIQTFREGYPEFADDAEEQLRKFASGVGIELP